jgi:hypothetical protein
VHHCVEVASLKEELDGGCIAEIHQVKFDAPAHD